MKHTKVIIEDGRISLESMHTDCGAYITIDEQDDGLLHIYMSTGYDAESGAITIGTFRFTEHHVVQES